MNLPKKRSHVALLIVVAASIAGVSSFALPLPLNNDASSFYSYMGLTATVAVLYVGAAILFSLSLQGFTQKLKRTYLFICVGFALLGFAFIQLPLLVYGGAVERLFKGGSLAAGFFFIAFVTIIVGMRRFARLFGVRSLATRWWFIFLPPLVLAGLYSLLPHFSTSTPELRFDAANGFSVFNAWIDAMALIQLLQIKRVAGLQYTRALAWMSISFSLQLAAVIGYLAAVLPLGDKAWFLVGAVPIIPLCLAGLSLVISAHNFSSITDQVEADALQRITARNFFGTTIKGSKTTNSNDVSSVDIVTFAASLASQPREIDGYLDVVRAITAAMPPNGQPTSSDEIRLREVYLAIESYLLNKEQVRNFTEESLRQTIANSLKLTDHNLEHSFWTTLTAKSAITAVNRDASVPSPEHSL